MAHDPGRSGRDPSGHNHPGHLAHDHPGHDHSGHDDSGHEDDLDLDADLDGDEEWDDEEWDEVDEDDDEVDLKEAFGLPDELPPLRLPPDAELAATARAIPMLNELAALAAWVSEEGRAIDADAQLSDADRADALDVLHVSAERFGYLWKYAGTVDWVTEADDRVTPGETAQEWTESDEGAISAWSSTFAAVLTEAMCVAAAAAPTAPPTSTSTSRAPAWRCCSSWPAARG